MAATRTWSHLVGPKRLRHWRVKIAKLTQREAADKVGTDPQRLCNFELERKRPDLDLAAAIEVETDGYVKAIHWAQDRRAA